MFNVSDLNEKYEYDHAVDKSLCKFPADKDFNKKDPFQVVSFINCFVIANDWEWNSMTYLGCKRMEVLIQEELPPDITKGKEIYLWIKDNWNEKLFSKKEIV
jgi:hypothetical protein